jgi:anti-repressor protein
MASKNSETRQCGNTYRVSKPTNHRRNDDMNSVQNNELTFHNTRFSYMEMAGQVWLTASEIGQALEYADDKAVQRIYSRHSDEFTEKMTGVVKLTTPSGMQDSRVFSLRGAHLIAMFARTAKAKEFRRWVLDILDREVQLSPIAKQFTDDEIVSLCYLQLWMEKSQRVSQQLYPAMKQVKSEYAGALYDIAHDIRYMTGETKKILLREALALDNSNITVKHAQPMLAMLRGEEWIH